MICPELASAGRSYHLELDPGAGQELLVGQRLPPQQGVPMPATAQAKQRPESAGRASTGSVHLEHGADLDVGRLWGGWGATLRIMSTNSVRVSSGIPPGEGTCIMCSQFQGLSEPPRKRARSHSVPSPWL